MFTKNIIYGFSFSFWFQLMQRIDQKAQKHVIFGSIFSASDFNSINNGIEDLRAFDALETNFEIAYLIPAKIG